jgi:D-erythronate 2-dehydrogenase
MKIVVIGARGFVGQRLCDLLMADDKISELVAIDQIPVNQGPTDPRLRQFAGDFGDKVLFDAEIAGASTVYMLASILGGAAEANYASARRVNVDSTLSLIEALRDHNPATRLVFASTVAVFSKPLPNPVTDSTPTGPTMVYGAHKLMMEAAISNFAARGWLDGVSLRLSGVMARDGADARQKSAFMSRLFYAVMRGEDIVLPVSPEGQTWLTSVDAAARNFAHAGGLATSALGKDRAFTLPALHLSFAELVEALFRRFPESRSKIAYEPDADLMSLFGSYPPIETGIADRLGFYRDEDADALVRQSF